ncbi:hypothetical protein [Streptomyces siamensis]|uniref:Uncharacterized protein n=1 Tax=Streptomyces siamensis TaxID=1274986 RepID=A0ABP9JI86_9ACTN
MEHTPTAAGNATSHSPGVAEALARLDAVRADDANPAYRRMVDAIAELIIKTGNPAMVFERVLEGLAAQDVTETAARHGLLLHRADQAATEDGTFAELAVFWPAHLAVLPHGQPATVTLVQLRAAVAEHEQSERLAADFQASVAAGHVEDLNTWHARTTQAAK